MENGLLRIPMDTNGRNPASLDGFDSFALDHLNQTLPAYATLQGENIRCDFQMADRSAIVQRDCFPGSPCPAAPIMYFDNDFVNGTPVSGNSFATLFAERSGPPQENMNDWSVSGPSNPTFVSHGNYVSNDALDIATGLNVNRASPFISSDFSNELSLSLATSRVSAVTGSSMNDACSEMSCNNELSGGSSRFSEIISGSRYLQVMQEMLAELASYSLESVEQLSWTQLSCDDETQDLIHRYDAEMDQALQKHASEAKKKQLLMLLQAVDDQYNRCLDEIHTVVSAFHAATELDPQIHGRFALQTVSFLYRGLRERISNRILAMGSHFNLMESEGSYEGSYFQKQWTLQQLKKKDQLWRPQRGLPERSVSVLRAWMFQNFLHPYPKDAEKHLLAIKSGLTRNQVSNWFINARVRLWKPMIEEMYMEMNKRKDLQNEQGTNATMSNNCHRDQISMRFNAN